MNGMVGIANKPGGYCEADVEFLEPFVVTCSNVDSGVWRDPGEQAPNQYLGRKGVTANVGAQETEPELGGGKP